MSWHRFGPLAGFTYGNGASFSQQLNIRGLPSERSDSWYGTPRLRETYAWDQNGNLGGRDKNGDLTGITDLVGDPSQYRNASRWLGYDGLDRLTVANSPSQTLTRSQWGFSWGDASYAFDVLDNLRHHTMGGVINYAYSYNGQGHLSSITQPSGSVISSYTHNARGQMTRRLFQGQGFNLEWDTAHRVTRTWNDPDPNTALSTVEERYRYDAHGHRARTERRRNGAIVETLVQVYSQAGDLMWERSSTGSTRKYARLGGRLIGEIENGQRRAIHTDALGSVRQKTDLFGTVVLDDVRAPYGSTLLGGSYRNGPAFTGHMEDGATGLTYMKARYYDPVAMRFISPDPVYVDLSSGGNFNRYWYANNNPYTNWDPDGRRTCPTGTHICHEAPSTKTGASQPDLSASQKMKDSHVATSQRRGRLGDGTPLDLSKREQAFTTNENGTSAGVDEVQSCKTCDGKKIHTMTFSLPVGSSPGHTHGEGIEQLPGPDDASSTARSGQTAYMISKTNAFAIEFTPEGYRVRVISGPRLSGDQVRALESKIETWNKNQGTGGGSCTPGC